MATFDPYYTWLAIPPAEQPPDHYRLLGLARYESNADVISHAADSKMSHVRSLQSGQHADTSQKVLNELSAARLCLLDAAKKAAYDAQLRAQEAARQPPAPPPRSTPQPTAPAMGTAPAAAAQPQHGAPQLRTRKPDHPAGPVHGTGPAGVPPLGGALPTRAVAATARRKSPLPLVAGLALVVAGIAVAGYFILNRGDSEDPIAQQTPAEPSEGDEKGE